MSSLYDGGPFHRLSFSNDVPATTFPPACRLLYHEQSGVQCDAAALASENANVNNHGSDGHGEVAKPNVCDLNGLAHGLVDGAHGAAF